MSSTSSKPNLPNKMENPFAISYSEISPALLETPTFHPQLSKLSNRHVFLKSATPLEERHEAEMEGLLPAGVHSLETEIERALGQMRSYDTALQKYVFLTELAATSSTVFYGLLMGNLTEVMPLVYTPTVGAGCQEYSHITRSRPQGLFITPSHQGRIRKILDNWMFPVHIIVVTDGSRILGLGDLGAGGMGIPVGKLSLYVAAGGFHPAYTLPVTLDFGTDNEDLLNDPLYVGVRRPRLSGEEYYALMEEFMVAVNDKWPGVLVQFEDFSNDKCFDILDMYRHRYPSFNDDIQGTGAVVAAGFVVAARVLGVPISEHRCVFLGAGSAGIGVADRIVSLMVQEGLTEEEARARFWFLDSKGLVVKGVREPLASHKVPYARTDVTESESSLLEVIRTVKPTALVGLSKSAGAFTDEIIRAVHENCPQPLIFPLSNPTSKSECTAEEAFRATNGACLFASGSPFPNVTLDDGREFEAMQANNCHIFPGLGMGAVLTRASEVTENMVNAAVIGLADCVTDEDIAAGRLYPSIANIRATSARVGASVAVQAVKDGVSDLDFGGKGVDELVAEVTAAMYVPGGDKTLSRL